MKIYRVINDGEHVLTTANELEALRLFRKIMEKAEKPLDWGWVETEVV